MTDEQHGLGRRPAPDDRDRNFPMQLAVRDEAPRPQQKYWPLFAPPLDQGREGTCVGHGWKHWMLTAPTIRTKAQQEPTAVTIYDEATRLDEWQGNEGDRSFGTSVRAGAKALQARGHVAQYVWAFDLVTAIDFLLTTGPLVIGVNWYEGMFDTDVKGLLHPTGRVAGGHCATLVGTSHKREMVRGVNSWGIGWGQRGRFWLSYADLHRLIREDGEVCAAVEQPVVAR